MTTSQAQTEPHMQIVLENGLAIGWTINSFKTRKKSACFAVKSVYMLKHAGSPILAAEPEALSGDLHADDDLQKSLLYSTDFAPFKPRADAMVLATAHAPGGRPIARLPIRIKIGPIDKRLTAFGLRTWRNGIFGRAGFTEPKPFASLPITYENAFGGPGSKKNPVGRGIESEDMPQVEDPRRPVTKSRDNIDPAGFAPDCNGVAAALRPRRQVRRALAEGRWPWFPEDFDYGYFNAAPRDQQIEGYLDGR